MKPDDVGRLRGKRSEGDFGRLCPKISGGLKPDEIGGGIGDFGGLPKMNKGVSEDYIGGLQMMGARGF